MPNKTQEQAGAVNLDPNLDPAAVQKIRDDINKNYPSMAYLLDDPEVGPLLIQASQTTMDPNLFQAKLEGTNWWKSTTPATRAFAALEHVDPGSAAEKVNAMKAQIHTMAADLGGIDDNTAGALAWQAHRLGWNTDQLRQSIYSTVGSTAGKDINVRQLAAQYMLKLTPDQESKYARDLYLGYTDSKALQTTFLEQAKGKFPALSDILDKGITPENYFAPYKSEIARMTGQSADAVNFDDPTWSKILSTPDSKTGVSRPMSIDEAKQYTRTTQLYRNSATGMNEEATFATNFAKALGAMK